MCSGLLVTFQILGPLSPLIVLLTEVADTLASLHHHLLGHGDHHAEEIGVLKTLPGETAEPLIIGLSWALPSFPSRSLGLMPCKSVPFLLPLGFLMESWDRRASSRNSCCCFFLYIQIPLCLFPLDPMFKARYSFPSVLKEKPVPVSSPIASNVATRMTSPRHSCRGKGSNPFISHMKIHWREETVQQGTWQSPG